MTVPGELEVLRVVVACPHHPEVELLAWRAYTHDAETVARVEAQLHRPVVPWVDTEHAEGETYAEVFPPSDWDGARASTIPIGLNGATLADVRDGTPGTIMGAAPVLRGRREAPRHLQVRLRCTKPSCNVDVSITGETRLRLRTEFVAGLWEAGYRGECRYVPHELGL